MKKIRSSVFETNSSSMHAVCIANNKNSDRYPPSDIIKMNYIDSNGFMYVYYDELSFGRYPFKILFSLYEKTLYAIASFGEEKFDELTQIFKTAYNDAVKEINSHSTYQHRYFEGFQMPDNYYGDIDHQSFGMLQGFLKSNNITISEFLLNPKYIIVIDGDEYMNLDRYQNAGFLTELKVVY